MGFPPQTPTAVISDQLSERTVSCYPIENQRSLMRQIWGKIVTVEGLVSHDPLSGRPMTIHQITKITILDQDEPKGRISRLKSGDIAVG